MKPTIIKPQNHDEWLRLRSYGIGASEVAAVLGLSPWDTPFSLWLKKTGQVIPEPENQAMRLGHLLEPVVVQLWEDATGEKAIKASADDIIYVHPEYDYMRATPDRIIRGRKKLLEIKTTSQNIDENEIPTHWLIQVIYQMYVTGIHQADLAWLTNGRYFGYRHIAYDEEFAEWIASEVSTFWNDSVLGGKEPIPIRASDIIKPSVPEKSVEADSKAVEQLLQLRMMKDTISDLETKIEAITDDLKMYMQDAEAIAKDGSILCTWKTGKRGRPFLLKNNNIQALCQ